MKKFFKIFGALLLAIFVLLLSSRLIWPAINDVETGKTAEYPELKPYHSKLPLEAVFWVAARTAKTMPLWTITNIQKSEGLIQAEATTPSMGFVDDVTINVDRVKDSDQVVVNLRSKSRVGKSDFGANARRIKAFLARLETNLEVLRLSR